MADEDRDDLDGCSIDFAEHADDEDSQPFRALFPDGDPSLAEAWHQLFEVDASGKPKPVKRRKGTTKKTASRGYDTGIADRLRAAGLHVVEVEGWRTRGSSTFNPRGSVDHHTAGGANGNCPSLYICIHGRSDLPGPLCNVLIGRDNTCYVVAAGRANHAGSGGWQGLSGNSSMYGIERENVGTAHEPWRLDQTDTAARAHAALIAGHGDYRFVCEHFEWTPRKVDAHDVSGPNMRQLVQHYSNGGDVLVPLPIVSENPQEGIGMASKTISSSESPGGQYAVIGDNLLPIGSTYELGFYIRSGMILPGGPEVWDANLFNALRERLADKPATAKLTKSLAGEGKHVTRNGGSADDPGLVKT